MKSWSKWGSMSCARVITLCVCILPVGARGQAHPSAFFHVPWLGKAGKGMCRVNMHHSSPFLRPLMGTCFFVNLLFCLWHFPFSPVCSRLNFIFLAMLSQESILLFGWPLFFEGNQHELHQYHYCQSIDGQTSIWAITRKALNLNIPH